MNLYELIFELLEAFVPVDEKRFNALRIKAREWYFRVIANEPHPDGEANPPEVVANFLRKYGELWYIQVVMAMAFIPLKVWLMGIMHAEETDPTDRLG